MAPRRLQDLLLREPLQWGRDFCEEMLNFLPDPEITPAYKYAFCRQLKKELPALQGSLHRERSPLAGGALMLTEGYPALRLLLLQLLHVFLPGPETSSSGGMRLHRLREGIEFMKILLEDMRVSLETDPCWREAIAKGLMVIERKGLTGKTLCLQGRVPLSIFALPYRLQGPPACYLRDVHGVLLFKGGEGEPAELTGEKVFLHEVGHALFANMVRGQGQDRESKISFLLQQCLMRAARRAASLPQGGQGEGQVSPKLLAENFCHTFVRVMLADPCQ